MTEAVIEALIGVAFLIRTDTLTCGCYILLLYSVCIGVTLSNCCYLQGRQHTCLNYSFGVHS